MKSALRLFLIAALAGIVGVLPIVYYRTVYAHNKRLRAIDLGRFYRSGQLTAAGFADAVQTLGIKTIVNVQNDNLDPVLPVRFRSAETIRETALCARLGVRYVSLSPDLVSRFEEHARRPTCVDEFLTVMDDPSNYPVLLHCKAGLHRTGILAAVYRMEYQGWTTGEAYRELKAHGFGDWACTASNVYVSQYVLRYQPSQRFGVAQGPADRAGGP